MYGKALSSGPGWMPAHALVAGCLFDILSVPGLFF